MKYPLAGLSALVLALSGCDDSNQQDATLDQVISDFSLSGSPINDDADLPAVNDPEVVLGKRLFFSKSLGGDRDSACVSCHHPMLGGGDDLSLPVGTGAERVDLLGPGRLHSALAHGYDDGPTVPRNAPTTFNLAAWSNTIFHDGRIETLADGIRTPDTGMGDADPKAGSSLAQAQARFPVTSPEEMKGFNYDSLDNQGIREHLAARIGGYGTATGELTNTSYWLGQFRSVLNTPDGSAETLITEQNISFMLGAYERSQVFVNSPWKAYVKGDHAAISDAAKAGALLFYGKANCVECHAGDLFSDEKFHNIAAPQIGRGKGHGDGSEDFGRAAVTGEAADMYRFRTPSLLNVEVTGPWTHAGAYTSLEAVVRHHLDPQFAINNFDYNQLAQSGIQNLDKMTANTQKALNALQASRDAGEEGVLQDVDLTDQEVAQLVKFLKALTDPCVKSRACLAPWIANEVDDEDPNGDLLIAVDGSANAL